MTESSMQKNDSAHALYWKANIKFLLMLLALWFIASFGLGILAVDWLDQFRFLGFPLGFWIAQQGSIIAFLVIIAVYAIRMNLLDKQYGVEESDEENNDFEI
jgi:putative solute:sodium symporter small subunit